MKINRIPMNYLSFTINMSFSIHVYSIRYRISTESLRHSSRVHHRWLITILMTSFFNCFNSRDIIKNATIYQHDETYLISLKHFLKIWACHWHHYICSTINWETALEYSIRYWRKFVRGTTCMVMLVSD